MFTDHLSERIIKDIAEITRRLTRLHLAVCLSYAGLLVTLWGLAWMLWVLAHR